MVGFFEGLANWFLPGLGKAFTDTDWGHAFGGTPSPGRTAMARAVVVGFPVAVGAAMSLGAIYRVSTAGKRSKRKPKAYSEAIAVSLDKTSDRAAEVIGKMFTSPGVAAAAAYMYTQALEDAKIIPYAYGDAFQAVIAAAYGADFASSIGKVIPF